MEVAEAYGLYCDALQAQRDGRQYEAIANGRKALYLEPTHVPSLQLLQEVWSHAPPRIRRALAHRLDRLQARGTKTGKEGGA